MPLNIEREEKHIFHNKTIRMSEEIIEQIDKLASEKNLSFNKVVIYLIEYALKDVK